VIKEFTELATELDKESYEWLVENHPTIADAVQLSVTRGATPEQVRSFVLRRCGANRIEFARRCEAAARHLERSK
jgi:glutathione S-transferase